MVHLPYGAPFHMPRVWPYLKNKNKRQTKNKNSLTNEREKYKFNLTRYIFTTREK